MDGTLVMSEEAALENGEYAVHFRQLDGRLVPVRMRLSDGSVEIGGPTAISVSRTTQQETAEALIQASLTHDLLPLIAAAHESYETTGLSWPAGGWIGGRGYYALEPVFPGSFDVVAKVNHAEWLDRWDTGQFDLAAKPVPLFCPPGRLRASRVEGMLLGLAIGDALGNTTERLTPEQTRERYGEIRDYLPNKHADGEKVGVPSDDTQLAFRGLRSLLDLGRLDTASYGDALIAGRIFGEGRATRRWRRRYAQRQPQDDFWSARQPSAGNGALMRVAGVLAPHLWTGTPSWLPDVLLSSALTHDDRTSTAACVAFCQMWVELTRMEEAPSPEWWWTRYVELAQPLEGTRALQSKESPLRWDGPAWQLVEAELPKAFKEGKGVYEAQQSWYSSAYLLETIPTVLYILARHGDDPEEALVRAATDSKDNDTVAAIVGASVGALHGRDALPVRWRSHLTGRLGLDDDSQVQELIARLRAFAGTAAPG